MSEISFDEWQRNFKRSQNGKAAIQFMRENLEGRYGGNPSNIDLAEDRLQNVILKACYDARTYNDSSYQKRKHDKDSIKEISGEGKNQIKAINELRRFIKNYPNAANYAMGVVIEDLYLDSIVIKRLDESKMLLEKILDNILEAYESGLKGFIPPKNLAYSFHDGCLIFPEPIEQKRSDSVRDSLIFLLAFFLRRHISSKPTLVMEPGMRLPKIQKRLRMQNQIIANFVNASLLKGEKKNRITPKNVRDRLNYLIKKGVTIAPWDYSNPLKRKI